MNSCMSVWGSQMQSATRSESQAHLRMIQHLSSICTVVLNTLLLGYFQLGQMPLKLSWKVCMIEIKATVLSSSPHTQQDSDGCSTRDITLSLPRLPMPSDYTHSMYQKHMHPHILELDIWNELYTSFNVYMHTLEFYLYCNNSRKMNSSLS